MAGDAERVKQLNAHIMFVNRRFYDASSAASNVFKAIKCGLSLLGICQDTMAEPLEPFTAAERETLRVAMDELTAALEAEYAMA